MKLQNKLILVTLAVLVLVYAGLYLFINLGGRFLLIDKLSDSLRYPVKAAKISVQPLFGLKINGLQVGDLLKIEQAYAPLGILDLLKKNFGFSTLKISGLHLELEKSSPAEPSSPAPSSAAHPVFPGGPLSLLKGSFSSNVFSVGRLEVRDSKVIFRDKSEPGKEIKVSLKDLEAAVNNLKFADNIIYFHLKALMPWEDGSEVGRFSVEGWLNPALKDMQAEVKAEGIDGVSLHPYYSAWVDLEKARIEKAKLNFTANIQSLRNNLNAACRLELTDIVRRRRLPNEMQEKAEKLADSVLETLRGVDQGRVLLDFDLHTKMDKPQLSMESIRQAFEEKLNKAKSSSTFKTEDIFLLPAKMVEVSVKSATGISRALIAGTFALGNEIKKAVCETFKKEETPEDEKGP